MSRVKAVNWIKECQGVSVKERQGSRVSTEPRSITVLSRVQGLSRNLIEGVSRSVKESSRQVPTNTAQHWTNPQRNLGCSNVFQMVTTNKATQGVKSAKVYRLVSRWNVKDCLCLSRARRGVGASLENETVSTGLFNSWLNPLRTDSQRIPTAPRDQTELLQVSRGRVGISQGWFKQAFSQ